MWPRVAGERSRLKLFEAFVAKEVVGEPTLGADVLVDLEAAGREMIGEGEEMTGVAEGGGAGNVLWMTK